MANKVEDILLFSSGYGELMQSVILQNTVILIDGDFSSFKKADDTITVPNTNMTSEEWGFAQ